MGSNALPAAERSSRVDSPLSKSLRSGAFAMQVEEQGSTLLVRLRGELDRACIARVEVALEHVSRFTRRVVFDLRRLSFLDVAGLKTILRANERARTQPFDVVVVRPQGLASRVFTLTRAGERLTVVDHIPRINGTV